MFLVGIIWEKIVFNWHKTKMRITCGKMGSSYKNEGGSPPTSWKHKRLMNN